MSLENDAYTYILMQEYNIEGMKEKVYLPIENPLSSGTCWDTLWPHRDNNIHSKSLVSSNFVGNFKSNFHGPNGLHISRMNTHVDEYILPTNKILHI
ncbi:hypothetical protein V2J09_011036 [Rumex salicifolius]